MKKSRKCDHHKLVEATVSFSLLGIECHGPGICPGCQETVEFTSTFNARVLRRLAARRADLEEPIKHLLEREAEKPE